MLIEIKKAYTIKLKAEKKGLSQNDLEKSIETAHLFTAKLKANRLKTQKTAHEN